LPDVLARCDELPFEEMDQALAYALLHLPDRYGRVTQALDELFAIGALPLRRRRLSVLEVGAGPAPGIYATADYYEDLGRFVSATGQNVVLHQEIAVHAMDRGPAWTRVLHHVSEQLLEVRRGSRSQTGAVEAGGARALIDETKPVRHAGVPFGMRFGDLVGFSVRRTHHEQRGRLASQLRREADLDDEVLDKKLALQQAYRPQSMSRVPMTSSSCATSSRKSP
jgi:hypothetical protein